MKSIKPQHHCTPSRVWASAPPTDPLLQLTPSNTSTPGLLPACRTGNLQVVPPCHRPLPTVFHVPPCPAQMLWSEIIITVLATSWAATITFPFSTLSWLSHKASRSNISTDPTPAPTQRNEAGKSIQLCWLASLFLFFKILFIYF